VSTLDQALAQAELFRQYPEALYPREAEIIVLADEVLRQRKEIEQLKFILRLSIYSSVSCLLLFILAIILRWHH